jgi:hypothetical protein
MLKNRYLSLEIKLKINLIIEKKINFIRYNFFNIFAFTDIYVIKRILEKC